MTNFNERTNTFLYKNIPLPLYFRKGLCWLGVRDELETRTDYYIFTQVLLTIAALISHLGWGCSTVGHWAKALCLPWVSGILSPTGPNWLWPPRAHGYMIVSSSLLPLFFRLFSQVHLLLDSSVEGQYVTETGREGERERESLRKEQLVCWGQKCYNQFYLTFW